MSTEAGPVVGMPFWFGVHRRVSGAGDRLQEVHIRSAARREISRLPSGSDADALPDLTERFPKPGTSGLQVVF